MMLYSFDTKLIDVIEYGSRRYINTVHVAY